MNNNRGVSREVVDCFLSQWMLDTSIEHDHLTNIEGVVLSSKCIIFKMYGESFWF
jgi:hypothetical protein